MDDPADELTFRMIHTKEIDKLKPTHTMDVNGINVTVEHIHDEHTKRSTQQKSINTLNNDCLRGIFQFLNANDLWSVTKSCKRLNDMTYDVMRTRRLTNIEQSKKIQINGYRQLWRLEDFLYDHGNRITQANVHNRNYGARIESGMVADYCGNITELHCFVHDTTHVWKGHEFYRFFGTDSKIEKLTIESGMMGVMISLPPVQLPQLKRLSLSRIQIANDLSTRLFFQLNGQIEYLSINDGGEITDDAVEPISQLKNLKRFCLQSKQKRNPFSMACRMEFSGSFSAWGVRHYTWTFSSFY